MWLVKTQPITLSTETTEKNISTTGESTSSCQIAHAWQSLPILIISLIFVVGRKREKGV